MPSIVAFATNKGKEPCHSESPLFCHCEHLKGAWQSHIKIASADFVSLAMTGWCHSEPKAKNLTFVQGKLCHYTDEATCTITSRYSRMLANLLILLG